jgi:phospholipid transport system transporter-binding protein
VSTAAGDAFALEAAAEGRVRASGPLTFATARAARGAGLALLQSGAGAAPALEIDCSGLGASDSAGLAVLLDWLAVAKHAGRPLRFIQLPQQLTALARISNVEQLLTRGV